MRDLFYDVVDLLELLFFEPYRYGEELKEIPFARRKISNWLFSIFAALSISAGMSLLSPPYTISTISFLLFGFIANLIVLRFFPFIQMLILDYYAVSKGRSSRLSHSLQFARHLMVVYLLFAPTALILVSFGVYGLGYGLFLLLISLFVYLFLLARGTKYFYDLKDRDIYRFVFFSFLITVLFPLIFNMYTATTILQSVSGGF
ncbi:hypothetical protein LPTSP4_24790 [Leptospira ryugenii]|uniref:Yip1 domain protein n=1 Tax=Leptospira ryugenii TaxID=1917863 RepID=A0A2P2E232_9LEPT|nr:hypothetical protein [Leptospira ryugenii]GBF50948.1 hypothetical protein LPTSP4_24790 [Leptospira ryugenii]